MAKPNSDPDLNILGKQLRGLAPRPCPIDRDAMMFRAGQASVPWNWKWPLATALTTCMAFTFAAALLLQEAQAPVRTAVYPYNGPAVSFPPIPSSDPPDFPMVGGGPGEPVSLPDENAWPTPDTTYFQTQNNLLRWGLDAIPTAPQAAPPHAQEKTEMLLRSF